LIKGRGLVLAGWIQDGAIKTGMTVFIPELKRKLTIQSIEMITTKGIHPGIVGLLFPISDEQDALNWKNLEVKGRIYEIEDSNIF
jgi:hypothetical protein